jgi:hypothetical protein
MGSLCGKSGQLSIFRLYVFGRVGGGLQWCIKSVFFQIMFRPLERSGNPRKFLAGTQGLGVLLLIFPAGFFFEIRYTKPLAKSRFGETHDALRIKTRLPRRSDLPALACLHSKVVVGGRWRVSGVVQRSWMQFIGSKEEVVGQAGSRLPLPTRFGPRFETRPLRALLQDTERSEEPRFETRPLRALLQEIPSPLKSLIKKP